MSSHRTTDRRVVVIGSANLDLTIPVARHVQPGETILGGDLVRHPGGKGANQAVGAARAGDTATSFIGALGEDESGQILRTSLVDAGVEVSGVQVVDLPSGVAVIAVDEAGENSIVVSPGANRAVSLEGTASALLKAAAVVLAQLEIPVETVVGAARNRAHGALFVLNAAPSRPLPDELWNEIDVLVVNEHEAFDLAGTSTSAPEIEPVTLARRLLERVPAVVITLGARGALVATRHAEVIAVGPFEVDPIDTTGAGDTFCGVLAAELARGHALADAARVASAAGALATTRAGGHEGVPTRDEVIALVGTEPAPQPGDAS